MLLNYPAGGIGTAGTSTGLTPCVQTQLTPDLSISLARMLIPSFGLHRPRFEGRSVAPGTVALLILCGFLVGGDASADNTEADWVYWRGPAFNGTAQATGLADDWDPAGGEGSNLAWKRKDLGGRSTPVVMDGRLYTVLRAEPGTPREGEKVVCVDAATGETIWENRFNIWMSDVPDTRVGWSSVVADPESGNVYVLGVCDLFLCIDGKTGETVWQIPLHEQFGMLSTYGGRTNFPVVHEDLVIISGIIINWGEYAKPNHRFLALDKHTGETVWFSGTLNLPDDTTYSAPSLVNIDGQLQMIVGAGDGSIWGFQPRTGKPLWHYELSRRGIFATPLVVGNRVFASHSEENMDGTSMGAIVALNITGTGEKTSAAVHWKYDELVVGRSAPVEIDGRLYAVDDRCKLWIIESESGKFVDERIAIGDRKQWASLLYADGKIYCLTENGRWAILKPTEGGAEFVSKGRLRNEAFYGSPIVAAGRLYFPGTSALYCVDTGTGEQTPETIEQHLVGETPVEQNPDPSQLLIVPGELLVEPGQREELSVRLFNRLGQRLADPADSDVTLSVIGPGSAAGGTFTADSDTTHSGAIIEASVGDVTGTTRARIVPPLPWHFTFDSLDDAPVSWMGARYRHVVRSDPFDESSAGQGGGGNNVLVKVNTIPKGARSRAWFGPSEMSNYTIAADVRGDRTGDQLPDIGLTAHGYVLDLMGNSQQLQIRTWDPTLRMAQTVPFAWKEDTWYRMKLRAEIDDSGDAPVAILRGKVWPRDQAEPSDWTVTATDQSPNLQTSPGLYGNAKVAQLYLDNIDVTAND